MASDRRKKRLSVGWALATTSDGRHHHDETAAAAPPPPVLTEQNDDEEERRLARQRRQSINAAASPRVRRKSVLASTLFSGADAEEEVENTNATSNLPPAELAALYQNCIKLSEQGVRRQPLRTRARTIVACSLTQRTRVRWHRKSTSRTRGACR